jgi:adenylate cyclase
LENETLSRKLAAVVHADAAGFSRLMSADERGTVATLEGCRAAFRECVARHGGRVVDTAGDSVLAVFESVVEAVSCALTVQQALRAKNEAVPEERRLKFRIGVNLGDVITRPDGTVYGDGVNLAARIEALAEAGGVAIAGSVYESIAGKLNARFVDIGEQEVKNIARPVRVYRVDVPPPATAEAPASRSAGAAAAAREKPDKPSIAVLPFNNMSGDPEQEFFADGITEDLITELSRFRELFVISRNSSFKYKGRPVDVQEFAAELGVQYVVEGSVRKAGNRVRITVQLIDAESDHHLWAERYDRELADIFAIQDEVTRTIVAILPGRVEAAARDRAARKPTDNMAAYECVITGKLLHHRSNREDNARARKLLERAIQLDPSYAHAHAWKACVLGQAWVYGWCADRQVTFEQAGEELRIALSLDDNDSDVHRVLAASSLTQGLHEKALYHQQRALHLNPNDDLIVVQQGELLSWMGQVDEGIEWIRKAMRLNPYHPERFWNHLGRAQFIGRRYAEAIESFRRITQPDFTHHAFLAACHAYLGNDAQAKEHARQVLAREPKFSVNAYIEALRHYQHARDREHHREGLLKAGLPA